MVREKRSVGKGFSIFTFNKTEYQALLLLNNFKNLRPHRMGEIIGFSDNQKPLQKCRQQGYVISKGLGRATRYSITPFGRVTLKFIDKYIDNMWDSDKKKELLDFREKMNYYITKTQ